jgi:hypothetical protein
MQKILSRSSVASKKLYERSEFRVAFAFFKVTAGLEPKIAPGIERKRDSIEFERSENQGQFFIPNAFNNFKYF